MDDIKNMIYDNSTSDQIKAIDHIGIHARLLAGPGTGKTKTITRRVLSLILNHKVEPETIILLAFSRLATEQLKDEIEKTLRPLGKRAPHVATLHSFALKQMLYNSNKISVLPKPIRIADDWEVRNIICKDLQKMLRLDSKNIQKLISQLSADWMTYETERIDVGEDSLKSRFLSAWGAHKIQYGETLLSELVYHFKKQLEHGKNFKLDKEYKHLIVDEYQDLNACDLEVIKELTNRGAELFAVGDDDQSIYGFRYASPIGIRKFNQFYPGAEKLALKICFRCDKDILKHAESVAKIAHDRLEKLTQARRGAEDGEVLIVQHRDQFHEAVNVAKKIKILIDSGTKPEQILILLRIDPKMVLSKPIIEALRERDINICPMVGFELKNSAEYRVVLSKIRLIVYQDDSLAWRTLIQVERNNLGDKCLKEITHFAKTESIRFSLALKRIEKNLRVLSKSGEKVSIYVSKINHEIKKLKLIGDPIEVVKKIVDNSTGDAKLKEQIKEFFIGILKNQAEASLEDLITTACISKTIDESNSAESEVKENTVHIMTMHQAKGLTFDVCFILGAEDEFIPGRNKGDNAEDEIRLLYVSMTRAKHKLFISYCNKRTGSQFFVGRNTRPTRRRLTRLLNSSTIKKVWGR